MLEILAKSINSKIRYERALAHILFSLLRDGCKVSCEDFIAKSFLSYCINELPLSTLKSGTRYFSSMGEDKIKVTFFKNFISLMREKYPKFGVGCFIDSTPLPNDMNSPFNALCSHGLSETSVQMRLILVIDDITLYPIWFSIIPGNIQDFNTLKNIINDVKTSLDIEIKNFVLDAGYVSKELIQKYETQKYGEEFPELRYLARMPARKGYPFKDLYQRNKKYLYKGTFDFVREGHTYFGKSETVLIFDKEVNCYIF